MASAVAAAAYLPPGAQGTPARMWRDAAGHEHARASGPVRIVSLVPSLTELVCDLGLGSALVGRTGFCVHPRARLKSIPKIGGTKDPNLERVRALAPTHALLNIDENTRATAAALERFVPQVIVTHPLHPDDNLSLYRMLGGIFGCEAAAEDLCARFVRARDALAAASAQRERERALYLIWNRPWMTIARDTYISRTLALAGWDSLPERALERYPRLTLEEAWLEQVEVVLLPSEPYRFRERDLAELAVLPGLRGKPLRRIDGEMTSWYGSRAIAALDYLRRLRE